MLRGVLCLLLTLKQFLVHALHCFSLTSSPYIGKATLLFHELDIFHDAGATIPHCKKIQIQLFCREGATKFHTYRGFYDDRFFKLNSFGRKSKFG